MSIRKPPTIDCFGKPNMSKIEDLAQIEEHLTLKCDDFVC